MRILFLIDNLRPGGAQKALLEIATALKSSGSEATVWCLGGSSAIEQAFAARGIRVLGRPSNIWRALAQPLALVRFLRREKIDVLQTFLFYSDVTGRIAGRLAKGFRRRNLPCVAGSVRASNLRNRRWQFLLARVTARWADAFTSVSWRSLQFAAEHEGVDLDRARVVPNGIDLAPRKTPPRDVARRLLDVPPDDFVIAAVGRLHAQKGHKYLLRAAVEVLRKQPNALFLIAGYGPLQKKLEARAQKFRIARRVRFLGYRKDVETILAASDLFVLPSLWEGMSNAILEAMAAAKPVVATAVDGNVEQVSEGETGLLVPPADAPALAGAILRLARDPVLAQRMGRAGRSRAEELFSLERMTSAYLDFYAEILRERNPAGSRGTGATIGIVSLTALAVIRPEMDLPLGGAEVQLYLLARALAAEGRSVTLYVADMGQGPLVDEGVRIEPLLPLKKGLRLKPLSFRRGLKKLSSARHQLYITRGASSINGLAWLAARLARGRYMHMCAHDGEAAGKGDVTLSSLARWMHHLGLRHSDILTCQNDEQKAGLLRRFGRHGVIVSHLPPVFGPQAGRRDKDFLWVGRDVEWKQPEMFVELARQLPQHRFTMILQAQHGRDSLRFAAKMPANLTIIPGLPLKEAAALFSRHRVFVCTSSAEGFPNTFLQAAFAGTPILTLAVDPGGCVRRFGAGLAGDGTMPDLVEGARRMMDDPASWEKMRQGALHFAEDQQRLGGRVLRLVRYLASAAKITPRGISEATRL